MYIFLLANIIIVTDRLSEIWLMTTLRKSTIMEKTRYERTKQMISILDYDAGNIKSVEKAVQYLGEEAVITRDRDVIMASDKVILPGVGSFGDAMGKMPSKSRINSKVSTINGRMSDEARSPFTIR